MIVVSFDLDCQHTPSSSTMLNVCAMSWTSLYNYHNFKCYIGLVNYWLLFTFIHCLLARALGKSN